MVHVQDNHSDVLSWKLTFQCTNSEYNTCTLPVTDEICIPAMKITAGHWPSTSYHDWWERDVHALAIIKLSLCVKKTLSHQNGYKCSQAKDSCGIELKRHPKTKQVHKWQRTYEREHQSMVWLHAELDDQDKSLASTLWCVVCRQYETRMCGPKNFSRAWIDGSSNHKMSNITDHACGTKQT